MTYDIENPFISASRRDAVEDTNFIGRENNLQHIEDKVILPSSKYQRASIAIIGLPDIGKYCLVNRALLARKAELHRRNLVPIEMDLVTYTEADEHDKFFRDLISLCKYELEDEDLASVISQKIPDLSEITEEALKEWDKKGSIPSLKRFFKTIYRAGIRVIFILNNFDHADSLFREHIPRIHWLRDLAGSECQITWIALACKPIREIKKIPKSISDDFFDVHHLGMFLQEDIEAYFHLLTHMGVSLTEEHEKMITAYCGRHPYLLSLLGCYLIMDYAHQPATVDVERTFHKVEERFHQSYSRIIDLVLVNDGNNEKLLKLWRLISGPVTDIEQKDIDRMLAYGLIHPNPQWSPAQKHVQPAYVAFSEHFQNYLCAVMSNNNSSSSLEEPEQVSYIEDLSSWSQTMRPGEQASWNRTGGDPFSWSQTFPPGYLLANRYEIRQQLEPTIYHRIVKAWDTAMDRFVAIKLLYIDSAEEEKTIRNAQQRLERERKIQAGVEHTNICQIYGFIENPPAMVMKWIDGQSLDQFWGKGKGWSPMRTAQLGIKLAKTLELIHDAGIIHRDIKPQNIMLREDGEPILIDFGAARAVGKETLLPVDEQGRSSFVGTPGYCAPEQRENAASAGTPADIFSLGMVLYKALTGGAKPSPSSYQDITPPPNIPAPLWRVLRPMISKEPDSRPDAQQLRRELEQCLQELEGV